MGNAIFPLHQKLFSLISYEVSPFVNSVKNNGPECLVAVGGWVVLRSHGGKSVVNIDCQDVNRSGFMN